MLGSKLVVARVHTRKVYLRCNQFRTMKCPCSFTIAERDDNWRVISRNEAHSHALLSPSQSALAHRSLSQELRARVVGLASVGVDFQSIVKILKAEFKGERFLNKDITNSIQSYFAQMKSVPQVQELLSEVGKARLDDRGLAFHHCVKDSIFQSAIWSTSHMQTSLRKYGQVVLFDPTCLTNSLRLPFAFFLVVDGDGRSTVVAASILANETAETFSWLLAHFRLICVECGALPPAVFYTDRCAAIHCGLRENFPDSCHLLCRWHLAKNIVRNLSTTLKAALPDFLKAFYRLAESNQPPEVFVENWGDTVARHNLQHNRFVADLFACRERWARCYNKKALDFGITTTSRSESMNAWLKKLVDTRSRLATLFKVTTLDLAETHLVKATIAELRVIRNASKLSQTPSTPPLVRAAAAILLDYPLSIFMEQLQLSSKYRGEEVNPVSMTGRVVHKEWHSAHNVVFEPPSCSCGFFDSMGLPCRHYLCLVIGLYQDRLPRAAFHSRWSLHVAFDPPIGGDVDSQSAQDEPGLEADSHQVTEDAPPPFVDDDHQLPEDAPPPFVDDDHQLPEDAPPPFDDDDHQRPVDAPAPFVDHDHQLCEGPPALIVEQSDKQPHDDNELPAHMVADGKCEATRNRNSCESLLQDFKEVVRLFGRRLRPWLDVCLAGKPIVDFPLPVFAPTCGELNDPAPSVDTRKRRVKGSDERGSKRARQIPNVSASNPESADVTDGRSRTAEIPATPLVKRGRGRPRNPPKKKTIRNRV